MIDYGKVRSTILPEPKVIDKYSIWLSTDIQKVEVTHEDDTHIEYEFNQVQYTKDEYIQLLDARNAAAETQITDVQIALVELYEGAVSG